MTKDAETAFHQGLSLQQAGDLAAASRAFARATELGPTDARYWISRGVALLNLRHFAEAARCLRTGVDLRPHYGEADARVFLADALWQAGKKKDAEKEWLIVSRMAPSYPGHDTPIEEAKRRLAERRSK